MNSKFFSANRRLAMIASGAQPLRTGDVDMAAVAIVQMALVALGHPMPRSTRPNRSLDGVFGAETESAVKRFQTAHRLQPDGVVGAKTITTLDLKLLPLPLPVAPPPQGMITVPEVVENPKPRLLKQPDADSCWAAAGSMLWEFRNPTRVDRHVDTWSPTDRINHVLGVADAKGVKPAGFFGRAFKARQGLHMSLSQTFFGDALGLRQPTISLLTQVPGILGWRALLLEARGPLAVCSTRLGTEILNHWFIVYGADATRSVPNRAAPPPPLPGLEFLNIGVVKYYDPKEGILGEMSIQDADHRIGPVPEWMSPVVRFRPRVFF
ncbi:MAG: peptidoglycan-binding domain-containing protein [Burkholderiaceae bacterium]